VTAEQFLACPKKRVRGISAKTKRVKAAIIEALKTETPVTVRQMFYRLVVAGVIDKTEARGRVSRHRD
jgi:hypothetical protein